LLSARCRLSPIGTAHCPLGPRHQLTSARGARAAGAAPGSTPCEPNERPKALRASSCQSAHVSHSRTTRIRSSRVSSAICTSACIFSSSSTSDGLAAELGGSVGCSAVAAAQADCCMRWRSSLLMPSSRTLASSDKLAERAGGPEGAGGRRGSRRSGGEGGQRWRLGGRGISRSKEEGKRAVGEDRGAQRFVVVADTCCQCVYSPSCSSRCGATCAARRDGGGFGRGGGEGEAVPPGARRRWTFRLTRR
jgi:hypothetical protein